MTKRQRNGRFLKQLRDTPENEQCWLIWSIKWNAWHRRSSTGGAAGYTDNLAYAGVFSIAMARAYHDGEINTAVHVSEVADRVDREIADLDERRANLIALREST